MVVRPAGKGGGLVVLTKENYFKEVLRQLADTTTYKKIKTDLTNKLKLELVNWVNRGIKQKILDKKEAKYLIHIP